MQLIAFFEGIRSERQLMETINLNLAHRWFIGYDLDEPVPDHSSLSKIRERYGLEVFQQFFEHIVELCIEAELVWGEELYFDSTKVKVNADIKVMVDRAEYETQQHLSQLFDQFEENASDFGQLVANYNGERLKGIRKPHYQHITDDQVCPVDPDAAPMHPSGGGSAVLGYCDDYVVDGGKARIILSALVTPASIMDNTPILDLVDWVCSRWEIKPKLAVGDARYGTIPNIVGFEKRGIKAYLATPDLSQRIKYIQPSSSNMVLRRITIFALKEKFFPAILDGRQSKSSYISPRQKCVMPVRLKANALAARVDGTFFVHFSRNMLIGQKPINKQKHIKKPCANRVYGLSLCLGKRRSFTG